MINIGVVMTPEQTLRELDRLVDFNDHLLPFEAVDISASLLRRVHEGMHALLEIATEAHHDLTHAFEDGHNLRHAVERYFELEQQAREVDSYFEAEAAEAKTELIRMIQHHTHETGEAQQ